MLCLLLPGGELGCRAPPPTWPRGELGTPPVARLGAGACGSVPARRWKRLRVV